MSNLRSAVLLFACTVLWSHAAAAKDLGGRAGLGFNNDFGSLSALSVRYGIPTGNPAVNVLAEADLGFAQSKGTTGSYFAGGRLFYGVVAEDNMNLYLGGGAGSASGPGGSWVRVDADMSAEWFFFGLENLGFLAEWGVKLDVGDTSGAATSGAAGVGVHYYF